MFGRVNNKWREANEEGYCPMRTYSVSHNVLLNHEVQQYMYMREGRES